MQRFGAQTTVTMRACFLLSSLVLASACLGQSVADAARASKNQHQPANTRKVITDDDMPTKPQTETSEPSSADTSLQADIDHLRTVYLNLCSDAEVQRSHTFSPEMKHQIEEAAQPLRKRLRYSNTYANSTESERLYREEESEVNALAPKDGRALTLEERQKIGAIRESYAMKRKALSGLQSQASQQSVVAVSGILDMISDCSKARSLQH